MKVVEIIVRILLGLMFLVFGLNGFFNFMKGELPTGMAGNFIHALIDSHYVLFVSGIQAIAGALLLINRFIPLALTLLGALLYNILVFHLTMEHSGAQMGIVCTLLWAFLAWRYRNSLAPLFVQKTESS